MFLLHIYLLQALWDPLLPLAESYELMHAHARAQVFIKLSKSCQSCHKSCQKIGRKIVNLFVTFVTNIIVMCLCSSNLSYSAF
jgi:hypothetical protein